MTYISRRTRIIVPRWLDECDTDHRYRVSKRRSDGRLKRNISCDDLRAWVNNNCIKHDYLVELMSNGEFPATSPVHVYGRFVPVPVLVELMQGIQECNVKSFETEVYNGTECDGNEACQDITDRHKPMKLGVEDLSLGCKTDSVKSQCKEYLLEKRLFECTNLLCKAVGKLEKIDNIVCVAIEESENTRNEEIEEAFLHSKAVCSCSTYGKPSETGLSSKSSLRRGTESFKGTELLRKISGLREKLKKIGECRKDIKRQIKSSQQRVGKCSSTLQVTELYSRQEQEKIRKLEKALEKLIRERGKLLSEMCQALISRHTLKKASRSSLSFRGSKSSKCKAQETKKENCERRGEHGNCSCGCACIEPSEPSESDKMEGSQSISSERSSRLEDSDNARRAEDGSLLRSAKVYLRNRGEIYKNVNTEKLSSVGSYENDVEEILKPTKPTSHKKSVFSNANRSKCVETTNPCDQKRECGEKKERKTDSDKKKQKIRFVGTETGCQEKSYLDNLAYYEKVKGRNQPVLLYKASVDVRNHSTESVPTKETNKERKVTENALGGRKVKSETAMKEIEKTLRNYEQRLKAFDCLEYKIENLKQKLSEANQLKKKWLKRKNEGKKLRIAEQEKTNKEMTKLCWENWELKRQVQHLTVKFDVQSKKVEALKCHKYKLRVLEGETEELKKELAEYQENFEDQRKCINKLENVVVAQKAEMEKLMNHIRKLTTMRESFPPCEPYQEKKSAQRSRSYSPEVVKLRRTNNNNNNNTRPRTQAGGSYRMSSEEEEGYASVCYHCEDRYSQDVENRNQMRNNERVCCCSPHNGRPGRCMN